MEIILCLLFLGERSNLFKSHQSNWWITFIDIYTGRSDDLKNRFSEHINGKVNLTKNKRPLKLIYYEAYLYKKDAIDRELYLKTGDGRREIRKQLKYFLSKEL